MNFSDSDGFCGLGLKVGNDGDFGVVFKGRRHQKALLSLPMGVLRTTTNSGRIRNFLLLGAHRRYA